MPEPAAALCARKRAIGAALGGRQPGSKNVYLSAFENNAVDLFRRRIAG